MAKTITIENDKIAKIIKNSGLKYGTLEYDLISSSLAEMYETPQGKKIIDEFPENVPINFGEPQAQNAAHYDFENKEIKIITPVTDKIDRSTRRQFVATIGHEMIHARQDKDGRGQYPGSTNEDSFTGNKALELETLVRGAELEYELHHGGTQVCQAQSTYMTDEAYVYSRCLDSAQKKHPNASEEELKREARTIMTNLYWKCDTGATTDRNIQDSILNWNDYYARQAANNCTHGGSIWRRYTESDRKQFIDNMDINADPSLLKRQPNSRLIKGYKMLRQEFDEPTHQFRKDLTSEPSYRKVRTKSFKFTPFKGKGNATKTLAKSAQGNITDPQKTQERPLTPQSRGINR